MHPDGEFMVQIAQPHQWDAALRLLLAAPNHSDCQLDPEQLLRQVTTGCIDTDRLFIAQRKGKVVGATWANSAAPSCATVWPPQLIEGEGEQSAALLLDALAAKLVEHGISLAQSHLSSDDQRGAARLAGVGFDQIAEIEYLACSSSVYPNTPPVGPLTFEPFRPQLRQRLADVIERTYEETMDCPALNGLRETLEVLDGYEQTGVFDPERWLFVQRKEDDVGCLLLADFPEQSQFELVYMGLVPGVRGRGWGMQVVRQSQWLARQQRRDRIVLAVDAKNKPAVDVYLSAGFVAWDRRLVFLRDLRANK